MERLRELGIGFQREPGIVKVHSGGGALATGVSAAREIVTNGELQKEVQGSSRRRWKRDQ